jgi:hypothetical protein
VIYMIAIPVLLLAALFVWIVYGFVKADKNG